MSQIRSYQYRPLDSAKIEFRLLHQTVDEAGTVSWSLEHHLIKNAPPYRTLSYAWGSTNDDADFWLMDGSLRISNNLSYFFRDVPSNAIGPYLWVDQLCIQQDSIRERNHQVGSMAEIYKHAEEVIIWLGPESEKTADLLRLYELIEQAHTMWSSDDAAKMLISRGFMTADRPWGPLNWRPSPQPLDRALEEFYDNSYWTRLWPLQEIILSEERVVYVGKSALAWANLRYMECFRLAGCSRSWDCFNGHHYAYRGIDDLLSMDAIDSGAENWSFISLIELSAGRICSDPRDKLYALMSLLPRKLQSQIDYSQSIASVLLRIVELSTAEWAEKDVKGYSPRLLFLGTTLGVFVQQMFPKLDADDGSKLFMCFTLCGKVNATKARPNAPTTKAEETQETRERILLTFAEVFAGDLRSTPIKGAADRNDDDDESWREWLQNLWCRLIKPVRPGRQAGALPTFAGHDPSSVQADVACFHSDMRPVLPSYHLYTSFGSEPVL